MKNKVIVKNKEGQMNFYLKNSAGTFWLFAQKYTPGVYAWFQNGRAEREILDFREWKKNPRLSNTILRIPREIRYVERFVMQ